MQSLSGIFKKVLINWPGRILKAAFRGLFGMDFFEFCGRGEREVISRRIATGGVDMNEVAMLEGAEPRTILQKMVDKQVVGIMSYLSRGKWHVAKIQLAELGACKVAAQLLAAKKPHPINIKPDQPVGISLKYGYGKFIFETKVMALEPSPDATSGGTIVLSLPDRIEIVQRRAFFRVDVPESLKVESLIWHRKQQDGESAGLSGSAESPGEADVSGGRYCRGRLVDISAGGTQIAVDAVQGQDFKVGQFLGVRFTPMPYERPLMFNVQVRNVLPTADGTNLCLGLQIVGLEASLEGREVLSRLVGVVEQYYQLSRGSAKQQDFHKSPRVV